MSAGRIHFLLVEDDEDHAELIKMALAENRVVNTIDWVRDGEEALAFLRRHGPYADKTLPDVILLDLRIPKIDGITVLAKLKADDELRNIPVVVLTTSRADVDRARAYSNHANSFVTKPVDFEKFHQMIKDLGMYWSVWNQKPG
ncbi:MAG: response regulator [Phycisphaerae bacterium]